MTVNLNKMNSHTGFDATPDRVNVGAIHKNMQKESSINEFRQRQDITNNRASSKHFYEHEIDQTVWEIETLPKDSMFFTKEDVSTQTREAASFVATWLYQLMLGSDQIPNAQFSKASILPDWITLFIPESILQWMFTRYHYLTATIANFPDEVNREGALPIAIGHYIQTDLGSKGKKLTETEVRALKECLPNHCSTVKSSVPSSHLEIEGFENLVAAAIILQDKMTFDSVVFTPNPRAPGKFIFAKNQHFHSLQKGYDCERDVPPYQENNITIPDLHMVIAECTLKHLGLSWHPTKSIDLEKLGQAFERIHAIPDEIWIEVQRNAMEHLSEKGLLALDPEVLANIALNRKTIAQRYAISLKVEAAIQSGNLAALQAMIANKTIDINETFHSVHTSDLDKEKRRLSPLELAVYYKKRAIVEWLKNQNVNPETTQRALDLAVEVKNLHAYTYLQSQPLSVDAFLNIAIKFDNVGAVNHVERVTGVKLVDRFEHYIDLALQKGKFAIVEKLLNEREVPTETLLTYVAKVCMTGNSGRSQIARKLIKLSIQDETTAATTLDFLFHPAKYGDNPHYIYQLGYDSYNELVKKALMYIDNADVITCLRDSSYNQRFINERLQQIKETEGHTAKVLTVGEINQVNYA